MNFLNKKVLIIGSKEKFSLEKMYYRAFKKLKIRVKFYHTENTVKKKFDLLAFSHHAKRTRV